MWIREVFQSIKAFIPLIFFHVDTSSWDQKRPHVFLCLTFFPQRTEPAKLVHRDLILCLT